MRTKIITTILALCVSTAAMAQSDTSGSATTSSGTKGSGAADASGATGLPGGWTGAIADALFSDANGETLRTQGEIQTNWKSLTTEQQAQVKSHCQSVASNTDGSTVGSNDTTSNSAGTETSGSSTTTASGATASNSAESGTSGSATTTGSSTDTTASTTTGSSGSAAIPGAIGTESQVAAMSQLCGWVAEM